ncbi:MAG: hypothetical protein DRP45_06635 [Candidatus Zixiibacteriota bacterium]|nr:MAG: hypothetical protein DRP45_06635 [candidate division Zixibacteria bacterium]
MSGVMKKTLVATLIAVLFAGAQVGAQETYFGKNKVHYKSFEWSYIQTRHFDIYFYEDAYPTSKFAAEVLESAYVEISHELHYKLQNRIPIFIYNSHNDFEQTNIISSLLPEGVGGFTEIFKKRVVIPFDGSYEDFRHVLHHELTHAVTYDLLYGNSLSSIISSRRFFNMPLWLAEGYAEYSSRHGWNYNTDMFVRDATINGYLAPPDYIQGFLAYTEGPALIKFIAEKYGEEKVGELFKKGKIHLSINKAVKATLGIELEELWEDFSKEMKRRYWPAIAKRQEADEFAHELTHARKDGSHFNEKPAYSPDGDKIAIFSDRSDFTEIVLISAIDGEVLKRLAKAQRSGDLESLHSYVSGMSFSPDGRKLVFVVKAKGKDALCLLDIKSGDIYERIDLDYYNIVSPTWSPDGTKIAFSALDGHKRDLFVYCFDNEEIVQITDDRFDDLDPCWMNDSKTLVFSSDRPHPQNPILDAAGQPYIFSEGSYMPGDLEYGCYNIFMVDLEKHRVEPVDVGSGQNRRPAVAPSGDKIAFVSNRNGIDNIYVGYLDSVRYFAVTNTLGGIRSISWSPDGDKIAFSAFQKGAYDIFLLEDLVPVGNNGVLTSTDYVLGKYDLLDPEEPVATIASESPNEAPSDDATSAGEPPAVSADNSETDQDIAIEKTTDVGEPVSKEGEEIAGTGDVSGDSVETEEIVTETGVYGDEYIFVDRDSADALDELLTDIPADSTLILEVLTEPALFDSIPPRLPSGEYKITKYKVKFTPDFIGGGFSYNTFFGMRGQTQFVFSDYLGDHQIIVATDLVNTIDQSYVQAYYFNNKNRINLGTGLFHSKNYYIDERDHLFSDRFYGLMLFARRPFSTFSRLEYSAAQFFIDRDYVDYDDPREDRNSKVSTMSGAYVFDNILWGYTGPMNGRRLKLSVDAGINLFDAKDIKFYSFGLDYRKYWHISGAFSMAFRASGGASFSRTPKLYFLGGTTNWIGKRTLDASVYEVENLYFAEVVTPLRGQSYYGISGDRYALMNFEFRFPLVQVLAMRFPLPLVLTNVTGVAFSDIGAAWYGDDYPRGTSLGGPGHLNDIQTGFGVGMRLNLFGFALLRYDLAWSTDFNKVSDKPTSYFSLGADF